MRKPDPTELALDALREMRLSGDFQDLSKFLANKSGAVVAKAAELASEAALTPDLIQAFQRIQPHGGKRDPGCRALTAIAKSLVRTEANAAEVFNIGIKHQQWEPSYGGPVDTAAELRGICATGLVLMRAPDALRSATDLLNDHDADARIGAVRALDASSCLEAELVIRFKAKTGDTQPEVLAACFAALLRLSPKESVPFVASFLPGNEEAILALGQSRLPEAVPFLIAAFPAPWTVLALACTRQESAVAFLLEQLESAGTKVAALAVEALALYKSDALIVSKVRAILDRRAEQKLDEIFASNF